jgi:hypothetical protein
MSLTFLNTAMIEQPASINQLSAYNLQSVIHTGGSILANSLSAKSLTADNLYISTIVGVQSISGNLTVGGQVLVPTGNSTQWSQAYSILQANSATWEESDEILPTTINYLSTNSVLVDSLNTLNTISSAGIILDDIFIKKTLLNALSGNWENTYTTVNTTSGRYEVISTLVENTSAEWNETYTFVTQQSGNVLNLNTSVNQNSANWNNTYTDFTLLSSRFYDTSTLVEETSSIWNNTTTTVTDISGLVINNTTILTANSANWNSVYTQFNTVSSSYENTRTVLEETSSLWDTAYTLASFANVAITQNSVKWNDTSVTVDQISGSLLATATVVTETSSNWDFAYSGSSLMLEVSSNWDFAYNASTAMSEVSSNWDFAYNTSTVVTESTGNWNDTYTSYSENSARFNEVYTTVYDNSATWIEAGDSLTTVLDYLSTNSVAISTIKGVNNTLLIDDNLVINGSITFVGNISALSAIQITDTLYLTGYTTLLSSLEVQGDINTTQGSILSGFVNIGDLFVHQAGYSTASLNWNSNYNTVNSLSSNWNRAFLAYSPVNSLSSNWTNTYLGYSSISGTLNTLASAVQSTPTDQVYIEANTTGSALKVKQAGSGNVVVIEDAAGTDLTPLVVNANGDLIVGHTGALITSNYVRNSITPKVEVIGTSNSSSSIGLYSYTTNSNQSPNVIFNYSRGSSVGTTGPVSSGDVLGGISWAGDDGNSFETAASIRAIVDDTVSADNVPGGISFSTLPPSGSNLTERLYIDSNGSIFFRTESPAEIRSTGTVIIGDFENLSRLEVYGDTYTHGIISLSSGYSSNSWNETYNTVSSLSSTWSSTPNPIPTITNYLSTELVTVSSINASNKILSGGIVLHDIFLTSTNTVTTSVCAMSGNGVTPFVMQFVDGLLTAITY